MSKRKYRSKRRKRQRGLSNILPTPLLVILGGIGLLAVGLFALWKSQQPTYPKVPIEVSGSPSLKVDREMVDLGDIQLNRTVNVSFQLANVGDKTLRFSNKPFVEVVEGC
jgi:hypothetical protein